MRREPDQAAPVNWITLVNDRCDLDEAFEALDGWDHFHTETIRGRIRSLQLRTDEAWEHFEKAQKRCNEYPRSLRNLLRAFYLKVYALENALAEDSDDSASTASRPSQMESRLKDLLRTEVPDSEIASQLRQYDHGVFLLHQEDYTAAKKIFKRLIRDSRDRLGDEKTGFYLGAAVAHRGLDENAESDRQMENACLCIPALDNTFNMGFYASDASALLQIWGRESEAKEWDDFVVHLRVPKKTVELFKERSRRIVSRTAALNRVFLF